jgi:hypothetical protein
VNKGKRHILFTWILLICFAAGQWAVYAHYHRAGYIKTSYSKNHTAKTTITEACQLCDAMLDHSAVAQASQVFFVPLTTTKHIYKQGQYDFVSIALILSAGRAPPVS